MDGSSGMDDCCRLRRWPVTGRRSRCGRRARWQQPLPWAGGNQPNARPVRTRRARRNLVALRQAALAGAATWRFKRLHPAGDPGALPDVRSAPLIQAAWNRACLAAGRPPNVGGSAAASTLRQTPAPTTPWRCRAGCLGAGSPHRCWKAGSGGARRPTAPWIARLGGGGKPGNLRFQADLSSRSTFSARGCCNHSGRCARPCRHRVPRPATQTSICRGGFEAA